MRKPGIAACETRLGDFECNERSHALSARRIGTHARTLRTQAPSLRRAGSRAAGYQMPIPVWIRSVNINLEAVPPDTL
eukprot:6184690-Pleurochrysis_carterae.AAC.2